MSEINYDNLSTSDKQMVSEYDFHNSKTKAALGAIGAGVVTSALATAIPALGVLTGARPMDLSNFLAIGAGVVFGVGVAYGAYKLLEKDVNKINQENLLLSEGDLIAKKLNTMKSIKAIRSKSLSNKPYVETLKYY